MDSFVKFKNVSLGEDGDDILTDEKSLISMDINVGRVEKVLSKKLCVLSVVLNFLMTSILIWLTFAYLQCKARTLEQPIQTQLKQQNCSEVFADMFQSNNDTSVKWFSANANITCNTTLPVDKMNSSCACNRSMNHTGQILDDDFNSTVIKNKYCKTIKTQGTDNNSTTNSSTDKDEQNNEKSLDTEGKTNQTCTCICNSTISKDTDNDNITSTEEQLVMANRTCNRGCSYTVLQNESSAACVTVLKPAVPFLRKIGAMTVQRRVFVSGKAGHEGRFFIEFSDSDDRRNIAFHLDFRINFIGYVELIETNNKVNGHWQKGLQYKENFPIVPHELFCIEIKKLSDRFQVNFDNQHLLDFMYRPESGNINRYTYLRIAKDIQLSEVSYTLPQ